jgi:uncharacterized repeat protein (TIGR03806 family)
MSSARLSWWVPVSFAPLLAAAVAVREHAPTEVPEPAVAVELVRAFPRLRFERPVLVTGAQDGTDRLFVVEQDGVIRVFDQEEDPASSTVFLDLRSKVCRKFNEEGLLGLAFHPNYAENGTFFVHYSSADPDEVGVVARFQVDPEDPNRADPASEQVVLTQPQPWRNHNGGMIAFGPDGYLYISFGDGGSGGDPQGNGQDPTNWMGSILRIDVDAQGAPYEVPADNPFTDDERFAPETWAFGLRNVWRFSFDRETGDLWAGDVGQNRIEEVDLIVRGGNYGWRRWEADQVFDEGTELYAGEAIPPIATYPRSEGISITGGVVYRGARYPGIRGAYFYADYATGNLWRITPDGVGGWENALAARTGRSISSFGEDDEGEVFVCSFDGGLYRLVPSAAPHAHLASWPRRLSETGLYQMGDEPAPAETLTRYEVNAPFWSDGADKDRFVHLPEGAALSITPEGTWEVPVGATIVKSFSAPGRRGGRQLLETRLIKRIESGWEAATYLWQGDDARLLPQGRQFERYTRAGVTTWHAPSSAECSTCHVESAGFALGLETSQLNRTDATGRNQIERWLAEGVAVAPEGVDWRTVAPRCDPHDEGAPLADRARSWLDTNCAMCHRPNGTGNAAIDLRLGTPLEETGLVNGLPGQGDFGLEDARLVAPGSPERSVLLHRVTTLGDGRMPNLGSHVVDAEGAALLEDWIRSL